MTGFIAQCLSAWSSYASVEKLIAIKVQHPDALLSITCALLFFIEVLKFFLVHISLRDIFGIKPTYPYPLILIALLVSSASIYLSISGSTELAQDKAQEQNLTTEQASKERALKQEIANIQNSDAYKTITWDGAGKTSKLLTQAGKELVQKRETELDSLRKTYQRKTQIFQTQQAENIKKYNYFFAIWEALFLLGTCGVFYYKRTCTIEKELVGELQIKSQNTAPETVATAKLGVLQSTVNQLAQNLQSAVKQMQEIAQNKLQTPLYSELHSSLQSFEVAANDTVGKPQEATNLEENKSPPSLFGEAAGGEAQIDTERLFQELLAKYSNGNASYLRKYQKAVEFILKLKIQNLPTAEICEKIKTKFKISASTFFGIWRLINNTKTE